MGAPVPFDPVSLIAKELSLASKDVSAVVDLCSEGNTVPFIARYRKEATGGLDETQIRAITERRTYLVELEKRRRAVLTAIEEQGKLTDALKHKILSCTTKSVLEDLYLPFKKKRRTRATIAREKGLTPLAERILAQPEAGDPEREAEALLPKCKDVKDTKEALAGARDIVAEEVAEQFAIRSEVRRIFFQEGRFTSRPRSKTGLPEEATKFEQYYDFQEPMRTIPSHRFLAILRGEQQKILRAKIEVDVDAVVDMMDRRMSVAARSPFAAELKESVRDSYARLLAPSVESDVRGEVKQRSDRAAVEVFADNLRHLLLAAPLGPKKVVGIDPGLRTGCKCVAVDDTGTFLQNITINLVKGEAALARGRSDLLQFLQKHQPVAVAVGNGTGGRETEAFVRELIKEEQIDGLFVVQVNESGASVYSASALAIKEFPELDVTVRGAISIARRLQDPLAELVKIDPKAIGVGQYQHDVQQTMLSGKLTEVVESCVNHVGVDLNTASAALLSYVAGIGGALAQKIVSHRDDEGAFVSRKKLLKVSGLGKKAFQQAAGFLRIDGKEPLDASAVHPERYTLVGQMAKDLKLSVGALLGDRSALSRIDIARYQSEEVGEPTLRDIVEELKKPGRDPRREFEPPRFRDDVTTMEDLKPSMHLEGVVTNVTAFGAFVDVGVHQDGLVHISELADHFVKDPKEVVRVGQKLKVRVLSVDLERKRISLSARSGRGEDETGDQTSKKGSHDRSERRSDHRRDKPTRAFSNNPFRSLKK